MAGPIARWIFSRVVKSALVFERESIETYRRLQESLGTGRSCSGQLADSLCHLLEEERQHWQILSDASAGTLGVEDLVKLLGRHLYGAIHVLRPLEGPDLAQWGGELSAALAQEEKTWVFYSNLRRMTKITAARKAFEVMAHMEKEHIDILRVLLGRAEAPAAPVRLDTGPADH